MSLGSWDPKFAQRETEKEINQELLHRFIAYSENNQLDQILSYIDESEQQTLANIMTREENSWQKAANSLESNQIEHLMRFFTLAEKIPGWDAGQKSPVIWLGKVLKKRGLGINRDLAQWIKSHSENKFLPHGSLL